MPEENSQGKKAENFGSAANLMLEALEKAGQELEKTVKQCIDQLSQYANGVDKNFSLQLEKVIQQNSHLVDLCGNELEAKRDETADTIASLENQELEKITTGAAGIRRQFVSKLDNASLELEKLTLAHIQELMAAVNSPGAELYKRSKEKVQALSNFAANTKSEIETSTQTHESNMAQQTQEIEEMAQNIIETSKAEVESNLSKCSQRFDEKITSVEVDLSDLSEKTSNELKNLITKKVSSLQDSKDTNNQVINEHLEHFKGKLTQMKEQFRTQTNEQSNKQSQNLQDSIERRLNESQEDLGRIADSARKRMAVNQKMLNNALRRLEKRLNDELNKLMIRFEATLAQEARLNLITVSGSGSHTSEAIEKLHSRLRNHGQEVIKNFKRQVDQAELDFARSTQGSNERIESIRQSAIDSLEKQVRIMRSDLERINRNFQLELGELSQKVPYIEESGKAAALSVMAYKSATLSLEND